jgi:hypothetical protein
MSTIDAVDSFPAGIAKYHIAAHIEAAQQMSAIGTKRT